MNAGGVSTATCVAVRVDPSRRLSSRSTGAVTSVSAQVREPVTPVAEFAIDGGQGELHQTMHATVAAGVPASVKAIVSATARIMALSVRRRTPARRHTRAGPAPVLESPGSKMTRSLSVAGKHSGLAILVKRQNVERLRLAALHLHAR